MRAFIAIDLPPKTKAAVSVLQEKLKNPGADLKWVEPDNIHLTLKFLGEIDPGQLDKINAIIEMVAKNNPDFVMHINSLGAFPKIDYCKVIWVGLDKGDSETKNLAQELEEKLEILGIPKEDREFSTHITIARLRSRLTVKFWLKN